MVYTISKLIKDKTKKFSIIKKKKNPDKETWTLRHGWFHVRFHKPQMAECMVQELNWETAYKYINSQ